MHRFAFPVLAFASVAVTATAASAHIALSSPSPRHVEQKSGPCGVGANDMRGAEVATFQGGETIMVRWTETVDHPGHFRISLDDDGHDDFGDPAGYDDFYSNPAVLVDEIADKSGPQQMYEQAVTLPQMSCDNCTLQLIQVMTDKPPYEIGTNDLYYQCADIVLVGAEETTGEETTTGEATTGEETTEDASTDVGTTTSGEPGSSTGADTQPTTGGGIGTTADDGTTAGDGTTAASGNDSEGTGSATESMSDGEGGCGSCRTGGPGGGGAAVALLLLLARRRRRG